MQAQEKLSLDSDDLSIVLRILAGTEGTVTHILEAYAAEQVQLIKVSHAWVAVPSERLELGLEGGERALRRVILLRGSESNATFAYADSVMMIDRLPPSVTEGLLNSEVPIGKLLRKCRAETFREVIGVWEERDEQIALHLGMKPSDGFLVRCYDIENGGRLVARITEKFPKTAFPDDRSVSRSLRRQPRASSSRDALTTTLRRRMWGGR